MPSAAVAVIALLLAGCTGAPTVTETRTAPPRPAPMAAEQVRAVDGCALISAYVLRRVFFHDGPGELHLGISADAAGCDVFLSDEGVPSAEPVYRISPASWPTAKQWSEVTGGGRTSHQGGGWLIVGSDTDAQELSGYSPRGIGFTVVPLEPSPGDLDVRRETAIMSMLLTRLDRGALPSIPWTRGTLLDRDVCAAAKTAGLAQALEDPKSGPLVAATPDARTCEEQTSDGENPRLRVSAGLVRGLDTIGGAETATIAGHAAVQQQDGATCRVTIAFPGDPALESRFAEGSARTTALTVTALRPCASVVAAVEPLVAELDRPES